MSASSERPGAGDDGELDAAGAAPAGVWTGSGAEPSAAKELTCSGAPNGEGESRAARLAARFSRLEGMMGRVSRSTARRAGVRRFFALLSREGGDWARKVPGLV